MLKKKLIPIALLMTVICLISMILPFTKAEAISYEIPFEPETKAIQLVNLDTDTVVYSKNADQKMYPASTTKIMNYIIVVEAVKDLEGTTLTVKKTVLDELLGTGSSLAGIYDGEKLTVLQLLNLMMVPSGNDAAAVLADYVGKGSEQAFVDLMNKKAAELGCTNTHFANSHGLHDENHYTTAHDMYKITQYAMTLPYFTEICSQVSYTLPKTNKSSESRTVITTNNMLRSGEPEFYYTYAQGIKTGFTDQAGYCLVSSAIYNGNSYLCVALGAPAYNKEGERIEKRKDMIESANLYRWAFTQLELKSVVTQGTPVAEIPLKYVWGKDTLLLSPEENFSAVLPMDVNPSSLMVETDLPESVSAPVHTGDIIGTATYSYAGQVLGTINIIATEDVARNEFLVVLSVIGSIVSSPIFIICAILVIILIIVYIVLMVRYNRKKREMRQSKKNYKTPKK